MTTLHFRRQEIANRKGTCRNRCWWRCLRRLQTPARTRPWPVPRGVARSPKTHSFGRCGGWACASPTKPSWPGSAASANCRCQPTQPAKPSSPPLPRRSTPPPRCRPPSNEPRSAREANRSRLAAEAPSPVDHIPRRQGCRPLTARSTRPSRSRPGSTRNQRKTTRGKEPASRGRDPVCSKGGTSSHGAPAAASRGRSFLTRGRTA